MKAILKVLIVWITLLAVPLQGFASATMCLCAPMPAATQHDHESMADGVSLSAPVAHDEQAAPGTRTHHHHSAAHHHCATCTTCGSCAPMAPAFIAVLPLSAPSFVTVPFEQHVLPSVDLALPERPPRA